MPDLPHSPTPDYAGDYASAGVQALLSELRRRGASLRAEGGQLKLTAPKAALDERLKSEIRARKAEILDFLARPADEAPLPPLTRRPDATRGSLPLSFAQRRLWTLDRMTGGANPFYNIPGALDLRGELDRDALERALAALGERHAPLRARFREVEGTPRMEIAPEPLSLTVHDLGDRPAAEREGAAQALCEAAAQRPFDLARERPVRAELIRLDPTRHLLLLNTHHIVSDGWSMALLVREISTLYAAFREGRPDPLPPLPVDYGDFALWQRGWLEGERLERQVGYWREALAGAPQVLALPADRTRPKEASYRGSAVPIALPAELSARVRRFAEAEGATPFMVLMSVYQLLLGRLSGQDDLLVGTPIANRRARELEDLIGFFANTLALRGRWQAGESFRSYLARGRDQALEAYRHQDLPFEVLVERLNPERALDRMPLVQATFALQNAPQRDFELPGLEVAVRPLDYGAVRFDLELHLWDKPGQPFQGSWIYATDLFDRATVERWSRCFATLLEAAISAPDTAVDDLPLLSREERTATLRGPTLDLAEAPRHASLVAGFAAQVRVRPTAPAATCEGESLSYAELDAASGCLAARLAAAGVARGTPVAVALPRSLAWPVAILGVLKAGGHYVPIDPGYPAERKRFLVADCGAPLVVTDAETEAALGDLPAPTLRLDETHDVAPMPAVPTAAEDTAYVIYTSGTTGQPKGVPVSHGNVLRLFEGSERGFDFGPDHVWSVFHSFAFDFSVWELWGALLHGGRAVVVPYWQSRSPADFLELLQRERVTVLSQTPTAFRHLAAAEAERGAADLEALRWVVFGGEALNPATLAGWAARHGLERPALVNMYGITETTVHVTYHRIAEADLARGGSPVGRPLDHLGIAVTDARGAPVPDGVAGEIRVWGGGVATGYLGRPELTAERFVPAPDGSEATAYRSGDLGRWRNDGVLEHLGRLDAQLDIRGFRIEPAEVEAALLADPRLETAVAIGIDAAEGERQLVAYAVPAGDTEATLADPAWAGDVRRAVAERLPAHMVPAVVVPLAALPLTANGKLDRAALPDPRGQAAQGPAESGPMSAREKLIAGVWAEVLGLPEVGREQNFFELGGDSILAILVVSRLGRLGIEVGTRTLFLNQTVAELSAAAGPESALVAEQGPVGGPLAPTPIQQWFAGLHLPEPQHFNQAMRYRAARRLDAAHLQTALEMLVAHHDALRTRRTAAGLEIAAPNETAPVPLTETAAGPAAEAAIGAAQAGFELSQAPLLRAVLVRDGARDDELVLIAHHLAVDTVSWWILTDDLNALYGALAAGRDPVLPPKTTGVHQWTARLAATAETAPELAEDRAYWAEVAAGPTPTPLPLDGARPDAAATVSEVARVATRLPAEQSRILLDTLAPKWEVSSGDLLAALVAAALIDWSGLPEAWIDLEGHGRDEVFPDMALTRTVGWFTALYPVRLAAGDAASDEERVRALCAQLAAVPNGGLGYGVLRYLAKRSELARLPKPQVRFNYLGQTSGMGGSGEVALQPLAVGVPGCHADSGHLDYSLDVLAAAEGRALRVEWIFAPSHLQSASVDALAGRFAALAGALCDSATGVATGGMAAGQADALSAALAEIDAGAEDPFADILGEV
jgi:amino acid adenylation domain-containing protein/non-ribosomal peptide synthase protein (TIGR01720 family)